MSAPKAFDRLTAAGVRFIVRDGSVIAKHAEALNSKLLLDIDRHREAFRLAVVSAAQAIDDAKAREVRT